MGRPKDDLWKHVKSEGNNGWECNYCRRKFQGSAARIRVHLSGIGQGITPCQSVPDHVKDEASRHNIKTTGINTGSTSNPPAGENEMPFPDEGLALVGVVNTWSHEIDESLDKLLKESKRLFCQAEDIEAQLNLEFHKGKKPKRQVENWLSEVDSIKKRVEDIEKSVYQSELANRIEMEEKIPQLIEEVAELMKQKPCEGSLTLDAPVTECAQQPLLGTHELVGQKFQSNVGKIWELLNDEKVKIIGVHGMGGVGKSTLVIHIHDGIVKGEKLFTSVIWVTVSQNFSIFKLQSDIAKRIRFNLDERDDERMRAARLRQALGEKRRSVLILDDVWEKIDLNKIGIPLERDGIKLILTSRKLEVCHRSGCASNDIIKVEPLSNKEAWQLFLLHLGIHETSTTLDPEVLDIAKSVAKECGGLPLGIKVLATTMKGVVDIHQWSCALTKLQNSTFSEQDVEEEVFKVLRFSYDRLNDDQLQKCFLYCSLYPEDYVFERDELIKKFVHERLINGGGTLKEIYAEGQSILQKLVGYCLLEGWEDPYGDVKMHDLLRDMACRIGCYMVKSGKRLINMPDSYEWAADLDKVSLMQNQINDISNDYSPQCPQLSTLILSKNIFSSIPNCFFLHMPALTVLDLSHTDIKALPDSISNLKSLVSLIIYACYQLEYVPPLGNLQALSTLIISLTRIRQLPQGLEMLLNLKWLNLSENFSLESQSVSVLSNLIRLQYLSVDLQRFRLQAKDLERMSNLEIFEGWVDNDRDWNDFVKKTLVNYRGPMYYHFQLQEEKERMSRSGLWKFSRGMTIEYSYQEVVLVLPRNCEELWINYNALDSCLCHALSFDGASTLKSCFVDDCRGLESMFCLSPSCSFCSNLHKLRRLHLSRLYHLTVLWEENKQDDIPEFLSTPSGGKFSCLTHLQIYRCHNMEKLLTVGMLVHLPNLVKIDVEKCYEMKEVFQESNEESSPSQGNNSNVNCTKQILLPKLEELRLDDLPELKRVFEGIMACDSFKKLSIRKCPSMERMPHVQSRFQIQCEWECDREFSASDSSEYMSEDGASDSSEYMSEDGASDSSGYMSEDGALQELGEFEILASMED